MPPIPQYALDTLMVLYHCNVNHLLKLQILKYSFIQGGALALYTAIHSKYKIGAFIPLVTWLPLINEEPPYTWGRPVNVDTPIFHMNGNIDFFVPKSAGRATERAMDQVKNYSLSL